MKEYTTEYLRNIALVAHGGAGKTMMSEAFLNFTGATTRLGKVEDGTTISDYDEEEIRRTISLYTSVIPVEYRDHKINILDAPGFTDFVGEMISALSVADGAVVLVDSVSGVEVGTEMAWRYCDVFKLPRFVVINKMDRENADFEKVYQSVENFAQVNEARLVKAQLPWGEKLDFKGVIDLISMKAYNADDKTAVEIPAEYKDAAEEARMELVEAAAEGDDNLMEKFFDSGDLSQEELLQGLRGVIQTGTFVPVFVAAAGHEKGVGPLLSAIVDLMPNPAQRPAIKAQGKAGEEELTASSAGPTVAYVWKTTADPFVGKMTYFKVVSGSIAADSHLWNTAKGVDERMASLHVQRGKEQISIKTAHAGDIAVVSKLSETVTGDSLSEKTARWS
jgi:elongation factor G